jgi:hypothetical protein
MPATSSINPPFGPFSYSSAKADTCKHQRGDQHQNDLMIVLIW